MTDFQAPQKPWPLPRGLAPWSDAARALGAETHEGSRFQGPAIRWDSGHGVVTLMRVSTGDESMRYEMRAPFWNPRGVRFALTPSATSSFVRRFFVRKRSFLIGHPELDRHFNVSAEPAFEVHQMLQEPRIRDLLLRVGRVQIVVRADSPTVTLPGQVAELYWSSGFAPSGHRWIEQMFRLFGQMLRFLMDPGDDYDDDVRRHINRLEGPGGTIRTSGLFGTRGLLLWDGDTPRRLAAEALGDAGDARAVGALIRVLDDPDNIVKVKAIRSLGLIGDPRAVRHLIPLMGTEDEDVAGDPGELAAEALRRIGEGALVDAFEGVRDGAVEALPGLAAPYREEVITALLASMVDPRRRAFGEAFRALAAMGAVETLPVLRTRLRDVKIQGLRDVCRVAIEDLESIQSLPRPAVSPLQSGDTLPRAARPERGTPSTLPRHTSGPGEETTT